MPLSPAPSQNGELIDHGLLHVAQQNAHSPYQQQGQYHDEGVYLHSHYGSPTPASDENYNYRSYSQPPRYTYQQHQHQDSGLGLPYDGYSQEYHVPVYHDQYSTPATSPPTPSIHGQDMIGARSGVGIPRTHQSLKPMPEGRPRVEKSPKMRKVKKEKVKAEKKVAKLDKPLSELTKGWAHVPVADIESYVNRSVEERRKEVEEGKIPGKVKRPMNSFMLYRKAYQNRTKDWCLQNNHQVVSQVCGDSWPLEPTEVKEQFSEWARIERMNHQTAHPGYKFSPSKPGTTKSTKRKMSEEPMSEESDLDDFDWRAGPSKSKRQRPAPRSQRQQPIAFPTTRSAYQYSSRGSSIEPSHPLYHKSSYQASNPNRPVPQPYNQSALQDGHYYQQSVQTNQQPGVEDVIIRKAAAPGLHAILSSVPGGGQDYDLLTQSPYPHYDMHAPQDQEHKIDPSLMVPGRGVYNNEDFGDFRQHDGIYFGSSHHGDPQWNGQYGPIDPSMHLFDVPHKTEQQMPIQDPHMHVLRGNQEGWQVESLDDEPEFDKWMDGE